MNHAPDHSNYEAWLLDRLEGNLTPAQERALDAFLALHPELAPPGDELPAVSAITAALSGPDKEELKRTLPPTGMPAAPIDDFLIAHLEGDLTPGQEAALRTWLATHPEDARAARVYAATRSSVEHIPYGAAEELKQDLPPTGAITAFNMDDFLVARLEGDLDPAQEAALAKLMASDSTARRAWQLMQLTRTSKAAIVFPDKEGLKKGGRVIAMGGARRTWITPLRLAASVALLLAIGTLWLLRGTENTPQVAHTPDAPRTQQQKPQEEHTPVTATPNAPAEHVAPTLPPAPSQGQQPAPRSEGIATPLPTHHTPAPQRTAPVAPAPETPAEQLAQQQPATPRSPHNGPAPAPEADPGPTANPAAEQTPLLAATTEQGSSLGQVIAQEVRTRVLDNAATESGPLGGNDALAAVDKGLRVISGDRAGLDVERNAKGGLKNFELRLGRNLAITASR